MIDKLKALTESIKNLVLYIIGPLVALFAYIAYEKSHRTTETDELEQTKVNDKLATSVAKAQNAQKEAQNAESNYNAIRDAFIAEQPSASISKGQTTISTGPANTNSVTVPSTEAKDSPDAS